MASAPLWNGEVKDWIMKRFPDRNSKILDVGAGHGKYFKLLGDYYTHMDAVEIYEPHVSELKTMYKNVYNIDIADFPYTYKYDAIFMGDVIEHMTVKDAQLVIKNAIKNSNEVVITIPYMYPQCELYGNVYEIHIQPDLTPEVMKERYPELNILFSSFTNFPSSIFKGTGVFISSIPKKEDNILYRTL